jgi:acyl carrier protein
MITKQTFTALLCKHLKFIDNPGEIDWNRELKEQGLDSVSYINLLFEIEDDCDIIIPDEKMTEATFKTPASLWETILSVKGS